MIWHTQHSDSGDQDTSADSNRKCQRSSMQVLAFHLPRQQIRQLALAELFMSSILLQSIEDPAKSKPKLELYF